MSKLPKLAKAFLFGFFLFSVSVLPVRAAVETGQEAFERAISAPGWNKQSFSFQTLDDTIGGLNTLIMGCAPTAPCPEELTYGAVHNVSGLIAGIYSNPPVSGITYIADSINNFGVVKPAHAQGVGFNALQPVLKVWKIFRNLAYLLFVILLLVIGFAIMFRVKLSPQTVITIQAALPRILMALILITFSYAIAGLLIDFIYVLIAIGIAALGPLLVDAPRAQAIYLESNIGTATGAFLAPGGGLGAAWELAGALFGRAEAATVDALLGALVGGQVAGAIGAAIGGILAGLTGAVTGHSAAVTLILVIILLFSLFRLLLTLIIAYIQIILGVIFAPLQILVDVIPGQNGFGRWFRGMLANVMVFPVAVILLVLGAILAGNVLETQQSWSPPLLGVGSVKAAAALISFGMLVVAPTIVNRVRDAIAGPPLLPFGAAVGEAVGPPMAAIGRGVTGYRARRGREAERRWRQQVLEGLQAGAPNQP